jgi:hypothetical protein
VVVNRMFNQDWSESRRIEVVNMLNINTLILDIAVGNMLNINVEEISSSAVVNRCSTNDWNKEGSESRCIAVVNMLNINTLIHDIAVDNMLNINVEKCGCDQDV